MKIIKKAFAGLLCLCTIFSVVGCKNDGTASGDQWEYVTSEYYVYDDTDSSDNISGNYQDAENNEGTTNNGSSGGNSSTVGDSHRNEVLPSGNDATIDTSKFKNKHLKLMFNFKIDGSDTSDIVTAYKSGLDSWMKRYNCTYELMETELNYSKLQAAIAANNAPDLFYQVESYPQIAAVGLVQPIEKYIPENQKYLSEQSIKESIWAGHIYSIFVSEGLGRTYLRYDPDIFMERGIKTPREYFMEDNWTWDTFREIAKSITKNNVYGANFGQFATFGCKDIVSVDAGSGKVTSTLNSPWNTAFYQWIYRLNVEDKIFAPDNNSTYAMSVVQLDAQPKYDSNGKPTSAMKFGGTNWEFVPFPKKPGDSSYISHSQVFSFCVPVGAQNAAMSTSLALSMCGAWQEKINTYKKTYCDYEKKVRDAAANATPILMYPEVKTYLPYHISGDNFSILYNTPTATAINTLLPTHQEQCNAYNRKY